MEAAECQKVGVEGLSAVGTLEDDGVNEGARIDLGGVVGDPGRAGVVVHGGVVSAVDAFEGAGDAVGAVAAAETMDVEGSFCEGGCVW